MAVAPWASTRYSPTADEKEPKGLEPPPGPCQRTTVPENTRSERRCRHSNRPTDEPAATVVRTLLLGPSAPSRAVAGDPPIEPFSPICPFRSSNPLAPDARNEWTAQQRDDYGVVFTALCLCVFAAGFFGKDPHATWLPPGTSGPRAHSGHPGVAARHVVHGVGASERAVARNLHRLTEEGLLTGARH